MIQPGLGEPSARLNVTSSALSSKSAGSAAPPIASVTPKVFRRGLFICHTIAATPTEISRPNATAKSIDNPSKGSLRYREWLTAPRHLAALVKNIQAPRTPR